jgi:glutamate-1-semialdehyde 2,1-aminomutase
MELGGLRTERERVFLLSTTHGGETHSLAAALATMAVYREHDVIGHMRTVGAELRDGINAASRDLGIGDHFEVIGNLANLVYATRDQDRQPSQPFRTLFLQETIKRGLLMPSLVVNFSHGPEEVSRTIEGVTGALEVYRRGLEDGAEAHLIGRPVKPVFRPYC